MLYNSSKGVSALKSLNKVQKCIVLIYIVFILWTAVFNVPWTVRITKAATVQSIVWAPIYSQPATALFRIPDRQPTSYDVGYAFVNTQQVIMMILAGTATAGGLLFLAKETRKKDVP